MSSCKDDNSNGDATNSAISSILAIMCHFREGEGREALNEVWGRFALLGPDWSSNCLSVRLS